MLHDESPEGIRTVEFLKRASPECVYQWFEARPRRTSFENMFPLGHYDGLEAELLARNNEIIDIALAAWGSESTTHQTLLRRHCSTKSGNLTIPKIGSFGNSILANLLANENITIGTCFHEYGNGFAPDEYFDKILNNGDDIKLFDIIHANRALAIHNVISISKKYRAYGEMPSDYWIGAVYRSGCNERIVDFSSYEMDSLLRQEFIRSLLNICLVAPKSYESLQACIRLLENLPNIYTAPELDELLVRAVSAWDDECLPADSQMLNFDIASSWDGMRPNERLQFHLWRVAGRIGFNPNDPCRHVRLAAYALDGIGDYSETNLKISEIEMYSLRDGAAFMYANSFNSAIWSKESIHREARNKILEIKFTANETYPQNPSLVYEIRELTQKANELPPEPASDKLVYHCMESTIGNIEDYINNETIPKLNNSLKNAVESINNRIFVLICLSTLLIYAFSR